MNQSITRSLIESVVRTKLDDLKKNPKRTTRNLIDMALHFSEGRFQKNFFNIAQTMLQDENSPYYQLIYHLAANVSKERLLTFGMNLGYNSCTYGAEIIRQTEKKSHFNIPWYITLEIDGDILKSMPSAYYNFISEGKQLGIFTWSIITHGSLDALFPLISKHKGCVFFLFCRPSEISQEVLDRLSGLNNYMIVMEYDENEHETFYMMQARELLYSAYICYDDTTAAEIINGELLCSINETNALLAIFLASPACSKETRTCVANYANEARSSPVCKTLPYDYFHDNLVIDSIISTDPCTIWFDQSGDFFTDSNQSWPREKTNLFSAPLEQILRIVCKK